MHVYTGLISLTDNPPPLPPSPPNPSHLHLGLSLHTPHLLVLQEDVLESLEHHLKHAESAAQPLLGEQVTVLGVGELLGSAVLGHHGHKVEWSVLLVHLLHHTLSTLVLCACGGREGEGGGGGREGEGGGGGGRGEEGGGGEEEGGRKEGGEQERK